MEMMATKRVIVNFNKIRFLLKIDVFVNTLKLDYLHVLNSMLCSVCLYLSFPF